MSHVHTDIDDRRAEIVLDHPPVNVLTLEVIDELDAAVEMSAAADRHALVLRTAGTTFSAGVDVAAHAPARVEAMLDGFHRLVRRLWSLPAVTLVAVDGAALGGGCELVGCCDLVLATPAARFGQPEIELACFPPVAAALLPRRVGWQRASEMVLLGESIDAKTAECWGLVNRIVESDRLHAEVEAVVDRLAGLSRAALRAARRALRGDPDDAERALQRSEEIYRRQLLATEDVAEGVRAFLEKRPPRWKHR